MSQLYAKGSLQDRQAAMRARWKPRRRKRSKDCFRNIDVDRLRRRIAARVLITKHNWTAEQVSKQFNVNIHSTEAWIAAGMPIY